MLPDAEEPGDASGEGFFQPLHVGLRFLQQARAEHRSWASTCHAGFRPVCWLGAGQASQVSTSFVDGALPKWCQGCIHAGSTGFVSGGLMQRVVRDRALELCGPFLDPKLFAKYWDVLPHVSRVGQLWLTPLTQAIAGKLVL